MKTKPDDEAFGSSDALGLTKREYFAAAAMQGYLANGWIAEQNQRTGTATVRKDITESCVDFADDLIDALNDLPFGEERGG